MKCARPVLRGGREPIATVTTSRTPGCGGSLTKTQESGEGSLAGLAKNRGPTRLALNREALPYSPRQSLCRPVALRAIGSLKQALQVMAGVRPTGSAGVIL